MEFEWDEAKRAANITKHGIDFQDAVRVFEGHVLQRPDTRKDYGEPRWLALGELGGTVIVIAFTLRRKKNTHYLGKKGQ